MPFVRRAIAAALWGALGPAFAGVVIIVTAMVAHVCWHQTTPIDYVSVVKDFAIGWIIPVTEAAIGAVYGLMRLSDTAFDGNWRDLNLVSGSTNGGLIWLLLAMPFLVLLPVSALAGIEVFLLYFAFIAIHIFGGIIAGFHVEYYLLHGAKTE